MPGYISSARIAIDSTPPISPAMSANTRYIVPMSLWLVEYRKRRQPCGISWAPSSPWAACTIVSIASPFVYDRSSQPATAVIGSQALNRFPSGSFDDHRLHCASLLLDDHRFENAIRWQS